MNSYLIYGKAHEPDGLGSLIMLGIKWFESKGISGGFFGLILYLIPFMYLRSVYKKLKEENLLTFHQRLTYGCLVAGLCMMLVAACFCQVYITWGGGWKNGIS